MAKELPYFRFYVNEWLNDDISLESYKVQGVFASICALYWFQDCSIAKAKLEKRFSSELDELEQLISEGIIKVDQQGNIRIKFLDEQFDKLSEKRRKRVEAGRKGGLARASNASSNAKAKPKQSSSYKDKDKDKDKDKSDVSSSAEHATTDKDLPQSCEYVEEAEQVADHLLEAIQEWDPQHTYNANPPSTGPWILPIERLMRLDGKTQDQIESIIDYTFTEGTKQAEFWAGNVQSGQGLRDHYEQMRQDYKQEIKKRKSTNGQTKKGRTQQFAERSQRLIERFEQ